MLTSAAANELLKLAHDLDDAFDATAEAAVDTGDATSRAAAELSIFVAPHTADDQVAGALLLHISVPHGYPKAGARPSVDVADGGSPFWKPTDRLLAKIQTALTAAMERRRGKLALRAVVRAARRLLARHTVRDRTAKDDELEAAAIAERDESSEGLEGSGDEEESRVEEEEREVAGCTLGEWLVRNRLAAKRGLGSVD